MFVKIGKKEKEEWLNVFRSVKGSDIRKCSPKEKMEFVSAMEHIYAQFSKKAVPWILEGKIWICPVDGKKFDGAIDLFIELYEDEDYKKTQVHSFYFDQPIFFQCPDGHTLEYYPETWHVYPGEIKQREQRIPAIDNGIDKGRVIKKDKLPKEVK